MGRGKDRESGFDRYRRERKGGEIIITTVITTREIRIVSAESSRQHRATCVRPVASGGQVIGQPFHESAPTDAIYLVQVSLEEIIESRPVDLVYVPLPETFERFPFAANKNWRRE